MSTGYTFLNGFTIAFGFVMAIVSLVVLSTGSDSTTLLIISLLLTLIGLQGWQYIQTLVRLDEMATELAEIKRASNETQN